MKTTYATRRRHERKRIQIDATFSRSGSIVLARTRDISLGGAFIETDTPLPYGTDFTIELNAPSIASPVRIEATVRWVASDGMGVQWGALGARESWAINVVLRVPAADIRVVRAC